MALAVGALQVECPRCHEQVRIRVDAWLGLDDDGRLLRLLIDADPADFRSHLLSHSE